MTAAVTDHGRPAAYLDCIHCGLCLSSCPTYRVLGSEMDSPRGRIYLMRALSEGRAGMTDSFVEHMSRCLGCRACETACPSGVRFGEMMEETRARIVRTRKPERASRLMLEHVFPYPWRIHFAARLIQLYRESSLPGFFRASGLLERWMPRLARAEAMMPAIGLSAGVVLGNCYPSQGRRAGTVAFFAGCVMNSMLGRVNRATVRLLAAAGYDVTVPSGQVCCGALANHAGFRDAACRMLQENLRAFDPSHVDAIIVNASGCGAMLLEYPSLVAQAREFSAKVTDIASFLDSKTTFRQRLTHPVAARVGYDDPCHLLHAQGIHDAPRNLLRDTSGTEFVEVDGADECCGSAGIYNLTQPELSLDILDRKMERVRAAKVEVLVTGNPGCLFQLQYGVRRHGLDIQVVHIAEFLERALDGGKGRFN